MPQNQDPKPAPPVPESPNAPGANVPPEPHPLEQPPGGVPEAPADGGVIPAPGPVTIPGKPPRTRPQILTPKQVIEHRKGRKEEETDEVIAQLTAKINESWDDKPLDVRLDIRHKLWDRTSDSVISDMAAKGWTVAEVTRIDELGRGQEGVLVRVAKGTEPAEEPAPANP